MNYIFETPIDTARAVATIILQSAKSKVELSLPFNIALSGGSTPKQLFTIMASEFSDSIPWHCVRVFWVDERCVSATDTESNYGMTYENLLVKVPIPKSNIFRIRGENSPDVETKRYQQLLENELPSSNGFPQFDLVLLGMGDDGHTASIFPNQMSLIQSKQSVAVAEHPISGQKRITLTGSTIEQANHIIFLITGNSKANVLREIIHGELNCENYPAYHFIKNTKLVNLYLDKRAASQI